MLFLLVCQVVPMCNACVVLVGGGGGGDGEMQTQPDTIFIQGLSSTITEDRIAAHFGSIGIIKVRQPGHKLSEVIVVRKKRMSRLSQWALFLLALHLSIQFTIVFSYKESIL